MNTAFSSMSWMVSREVPTISTKSTSNDKVVGGGPFLQLKYAAFRAQLPLVDPSQLKETSYLARGQCSQVTAAEWKGTKVAVKSIVKRTALQSQVSVVSEAHDIMHSQ